ncbi:MAG: phosphoribosylanthranilate isomerase [Chthoniobacteraceae bacterium]
MTTTQPHRTRVKICGITNPQDAADAVELGADALGFNTYPGSKRFIDLKRESEWIRSLPPFITKVAVMVKPTIAEAEAVFNLPYIDMVQFHGNEDEKFCAHFAGLGLPFIKAIAVKDETSLHDVGRFGTSHILIDAYSPSAFGGTGQLIDASLTGHFSQNQGEKFHLILSGGLKPANVRAAIDRIHPYAVDVASGVEIAPGRKDKSLMGDFILAVLGNAS